MELVILPHESLDNLTPLAAAYTPNLDKIASNGSMGQVITVGKGMTSSIRHSSI